jgi:glycosyltransferase involved in cell wall biosynthesis
MKICLVTPGQPSSNPRLVKEADALSAAGYDVHVVGAHHADWATESDRELMPGKRWHLTFVDWRRHVAPVLHHASRVRHWATRTLLPPSATTPGLVAAALTRVGPEIGRAAAAVRADLYIAHNLAALPIVGRVAAARRVLAGFDAEDFHRGQLSDGDSPALLERTRAVEARFMKGCAYLTAASPAIAEAYRDACGVSLPTTILNVFPLADRPAELRTRELDGPVRLYWFSQTIGPNRGLEDVVQAMGQLRDEHPELHLRGLWADGFETQLRTLARNCGVDNGRIIAHGPALASEMVREAGQYDIGLAIEPGDTVNNSLAISNKLFTYVLAGTPALITRTAGPLRLARELGTSVGWCDPQSPASMTAALRAWLQDRSKLAKASVEAWRLGERRFNWDVEQRTFLARIAEVTASAPARVSTTSSPLRVDSAVRS